MHITLLEVFDILGTTLLGLSVIHFAINFMKLHNAMYIDDAVASSKTRLYKKQHSIYLYSGLCALMGKVFVSYHPVIIWPVICLSSCLYLGCLGCWVYNFILSRRFKQKGE